MTCPMTPHLGVYAPGATGGFWLAPQGSGPPPDRKGGTW